MDNKADKEVFSKLQKLHEELGYFSDSDQITSSKKLKKRPNLRKQQDKKHNSDHT